MPIQSRWTTPTPSISLPSWVFDSQSNGDRTTFVDASNPKNTLSFFEFQQYSKRLALGLRRLGVKQGDRVLVFCENGIFVPCLFMGIIMAGAIYTGATPSSTVLELSYQLQDSGSIVLIASTNLMKIAVETTRSTGFPHDHLFHLDGIGASKNTKPHQDVRSWNDILASSHDAERFTWFEPSDPKTAICCLNYSSGTTGRPKGVQVTHFAYVANGEAHMILYQLQQEAWGNYTGRALCFLPMNHVAAQTTFMANCPKMGMETYIMTGYTVESMIRHVENFQITELMIAPPVVASLLANLKLVGDRLTSVKNVICGSAPLAPALSQRASQLFKDGRVVIRQGWGMTEMVCMGSMNDPRITGSLASVGEAAPNSTIKLMNGPKEVTKVNENGELWFTGPTLMEGYWKNPEATKETIVEQDGTRWLKTGDIAYVDSLEPGAQIYIVDRSKEIFKVKGFQVAPVELEAILATHPDIIDNGVIGVDLNGRDAARAYVVRRPGAGVTPQDIKTWMESKVAAYKRLDGGVIFIDAIPRTQSGKILRRVLRDYTTGEADGVISMKAKLA
ncbi:4-coumarate--CoA ligase-like 7 [Fusarium oxysporum f. sp. rapae]|uniref:4-coumarate--CoA ligase-like 7 n=1 Tax=Fusarium oxysporum f. sp. rapae TaxID=485398 RepID=A0A8J5TX85_FUSOX|nr:4-coumarate--CoA ligase-like 7 [Fusarium oxysporum f. sp. rapae]